MPAIIPWFIISFSWLSHFATPSLFTLTRGLICENEWQWKPQIALNILVWVEKEIKNRFKITRLANYNLWAKGLIT
jgi:hypothetical protein